MSQAIVNLTLPIVNEKIDDILVSYPLDPHRIAFRDPELRQKLASYVLSRLSVVYVTMDNDEAVCLTSPVGCYSSDQHEQINRLIRQGIDSLIQRQRWQPRFASDSVEPELTPSNWFG
jgi:hypothetical protein